MDVRITTRRATVGDAFHRHADERARRLTRYEPALHGVSIVVDEDRGRVSVEIRAEVPGGPPRIARSEATTDRSALDAAFQKLRRQLRRQRTRRLDHQAPSAGTVVEE